VGGVRGLAGRLLMLWLLLQWLLLQWLWQWLWLWPAAAGEEGGIGGPQGTRTGAGAGAGGGPASESESLLLGALRGGGRSGDLVRATGDGVELVLLPLRSWFHVRVELVRKEEAYLQTADVRVCRQPLHPFHKISSYHTIHPPFSQ
jgi:hypothetical protein